MESRTAMEKIIADRLSVDTIEEVLLFPKYFEIETINICNSRCIMCPVDKWRPGEQKRKIMSRELFNKFVDEVKQYSDWIEKVALFKNGEPLLDVDLVNKIKELKKIGIKKVNVTTNASLLDNKLALELIEGGLDEADISMDSIRKEVYSKIRRGLDFDTVLNNIINIIRQRDMLGSKMNIRIRMVLLEENRDEVTEWMDYWQAKANPNIDSVYVLQNHFWGDAAQSEQTLIYTPCISPFSTVVMHYDGSVAMCGADYQLNNKMGDFNKQSIKDIWNETAFSKLREMHLGGERVKIDACKACTYWDKNKIVADSVSR